MSALDSDGAPITVVCQPRDVELYGRLAPRSRIVPTSESNATRTARLTWEQTTLPRLVRRLGVDVLHSPHYTTALANPAASVVTLHDATFFTDAVLHHSIKARFFRAWTRTALPARRCASCPSAATAAELARVARRRPAAAGDHPARRGQRTLPPADRRGGRGGAAARRPRPDTPYVAFLGALEPRKNVPALIRGFAAACRGRDGPARAGARRPAGLGPPGGARAGRRAAPAARDPRRLPAVRATSPGSSAGPSWSRTRRWARASACRCWRRWRAARAC